MDSYGNSIFIENIEKGPHWPSKGVWYCKPWYFTGET